MHRRDGRKQHPFRPKKYWCSGAGFQRPDNEQCWRPSTSDEIIFEMFDFATGVVTDGDINENADEDARRVDIHVGSPLSRSELNKAYFLERG